MQKISLFHQKQKVICLQILGAFLVSPVVGCNFTRELAVSMEKKNWYRGLYKTLRAARTRWPTCGSFLHPTLVTRQLLRMVESTTGITRHPFAIVVSFACRRPSPATPPPPSSVPVVLLHCRTNSGRKDLPARSDFCYPWRHPTTCMLRFIIHAMYSVDALLLFFSPHKSSLDPVLAKNLR